MSASRLAIKLRESEAYVPQNPYCAGCENHWEMVTYSIAEPTLHKTAKDEAMGDLQSTLFGL